MNKARGPRLAWLLLLLLSVGFVRAQSSEEAAGQAAEQAGKPREAVTHYVAALQSASEASDDDQRLRELIIKLVLKLDPPPALPDKVYEYQGRAQSAVKLASGREDFKQAAVEFQKALRLAPWWADGYRILGAVQEKAGDLKAAVRSLKLFLLAVTDAAEANKVRMIIGEIEYRQENEERDAAAKRSAEEAARQRTERERQEQASIVYGLAGVWEGTEPRDSNSTYSTFYRYVISVNGDSIEMEQTEVHIGSRRYPLNYRQIFRATANGLAIRGTCTTVRNGKAFARPMTGTISSDGSRIHVDYGWVGPPEMGWLEGKGSVDLVRWRR